MLNEKKLWHFLFEVDPKKSKRNREKSDSFQKVLLAELTLSLYKKVFLKYDAKE